MRDEGRGPGGKREYHYLNLLNDDDRALCSV